ncbi:AEC family transporter [Kushneria aurantia]|uniref:AEC family transporter n=1 Tax=Kushneria aurantia TaxID=504092 RepID=A0ABV6FZG6_9GAMM|nr:AEC family transporter [Kushneria aurantia]
MQELLTALWPIFALIVAGYGLMRRGLPDPHFWPGAERLNYFVLFPALLFSSLADAPFDDSALPRLLTAIGLILALCSLTLWSLRRHWRWPAARFGVMVQGTLRFNTYLGLAVVTSLFGGEGLKLAAVVLALLVPMVNVLSVVALTGDETTSAKRLLRPIVKNPLILACAAGALFNLAGGELGGGVDRLLSLTAAASLPLGLLCVGAALRPQQLGGEIATLAITSTIRLLLIPCLAAAVAMLLQLPSMERTLVVLFFSLPTAPAAYVLTRQLGGDSQLMAGVITLQTLLAALSLMLIVTLITAIPG